jgi:hypothetical protein
MRFKEFRIGRPQVISPAPKHCRNHHLVDGIVVYN